MPPGRSSAKRSNSSCGSRSRSLAKHGSLRAAVQGVSEARVTVNGETIGEITHGFLVLLGVSPTDTPAVAVKMAVKVAGLRVFEDTEGRMNLGLKDTGGAVLCVSQFTLYGDIRKGRRPSFDAAARPELAGPLYEAFCAAIEAEGIRCERGRFGAHMAVHLVNDGPVTLILDSDALEAPRRS